MIWFFISQIFLMLLTLIRLVHTSETNKALEIIILRHQLDVMVRKQPKSIRPNYAEKATLVLLTTRQKKNTNRTIRQLWEVIRIVRPETIIRWHRECVRRKRDQPSLNETGRPPIEKETENLIVRLAKENLRWGYYRIPGELKKNVLDRNGILPAPVPYGSIG